MIRIALVCIAPLRHDSRVLRHAGLLSRAGYDVRIFAQAPLPDTAPTPVTVLPGPGSDTRVRLGMVLRQSPASLLPRSADALYWCSATRLVARRELLHFRPDIVIANDWRALPIAHAAKRAFKTRIIYDSHEFASEEFADSLRWRLLARRHVMRIEERHIREADSVITVSEGIADALEKRYDLARPTVIMNIPAWEQTPFRATGSSITVLYHGAVVPRRGLETLIESVRLWPPAFRLVIRGPTQAGFDQHLRALANDLGERVTFEPAVPSDQVVSAAAKADIGIFLLSNSTTHACFAMPNKIFEYMQAGLMIVSSNLPEVGNIIEKNKCGILLDGDNPAAISACLEMLTLEKIDEYKRSSLSASIIFNFDNESVKLLNLVNNIRNNISIL